jgi:hypothetical protein
MIFFCAISKKTEYYWHSTRRALNKTLKMRIRPNAMEG